jgi:sterol desaturase/sphingolipid hydroxylase (fatty acid hydroxylase superfamily)
LTDFIIGNTAAIRLAFFLGVFGLMALWELIAPRRPLGVSKPVRWYTNLGLVSIDSVLSRVLIPAQAIGVAVFVEGRGVGILNALPLPQWTAILFGVVALDFVIYLQHAMFHAIPAFWRFHMVHHTDLDVDTTTGVRFHPVEILLSMGIKMGAVAVVGAPVVAVVVFEVLLNVTSMFNHGNVRLEKKLDGVLRFLVVTPEMHRVHHSVIGKEHNSNFGFNLPWWDRLLGTYRAQPEAGHEGMTIGLGPFRDSKALTLPRLLILPFTKRPGKAMY